MRRRENELGDERIDEEKREKTRRRGNKGGDERIDEETRKEMRGDNR